MYAGSVSDFTHDFIRVEIDHDNFRRMREIQTARGIVNGQDVPAAFAADGDLREGLVEFGGSGAGGLNEESAAGDSEQSNGTHPVIICSIGRTARERAGFRSAHARLQGITVSGHLW